MEWLARRVEGAGTVAVLVGAQLLLAAMMVFDWRLPVAVVAAVAMVLVAVTRPVWCVGLLIAGRLISTGSMSFLRIGKVNIGLFEPILLLSLAALAVHAVTRRQRLLHTFSWFAPMLTFLAWQFLGLGWTVSKSEGLQEILGVGVILTNAMIILSFVKSYEDFLDVVRAWLGSAVLIGLLAMTTDWTGVGDVKSTWEVAAGGGRETGLGQQPNWFAMNLMFIVLTSFAMALVEKRVWLRWLYVLAGTFVFFSQMRSGSRGGIYSLVIGSVIVALAHPIARRWILRFGAIAVSLIAGAAVVGGASSTAKAAMRIVMNLDNTWGEDVRQQNWLVCFQMFGDTWGRGIGPGGYADLIAEYNWQIYDSIHKYPHGIFWGIVAHYGVVGLFLAGWLLWRVGVMTREMVADSRKTAPEVFVWTMLATMVGYIAWSFVEFNFDDKPFWEFLSLYTALAIALRRAKEGGVALPALPEGLERLRPKEGADA